MKNTWLKLYALGSSVIIITALFYWVSAAEKPQEAVVSTVNLWEQKESVTQDIYISLITDTQISSDLVVGNDKDSRFIQKKYVDSIDAFMEHVSQTSPLFVVHLGDVIEGTDIKRKIGMEELRLVKERFDLLEQETFWVVGNHDLRSVTRRDFHEVMGIDYSNTYFDKEGSRFIILDSSFRGDGVPNNPLSKDFVPGYIPKETFSWLREVLDTSKEVYVFMHHSPVPHRFTDKRQLGNAGDLREIFTEYNVNSVFSGHIEKRFYGELKGVKYFTLPGIWKNSSYQGAFYDLVIKDGEPEITMHYESELNGELITEPFVVEGKMSDEILDALEALENEKEI